MKKIVFSVFVLLVLSQAGKAQYLKAVLVQLSSEQNRIQFFRQHGKPAEANEVEREAGVIARKTAKDFRDNFKCGPYYFYFDTNITQVKNKQFDGVLLGPDLKPILTPVLSASDSNYYIIYYGVPEDNGVSPINWKGCVILDDKFRQLPHKAIRKGDYDPKYSYTSSKYNMSYRPIAAWLRYALRGLCGD